VWNYKMSFLWTIWNERNKIIFQNKKHSSIRVLGNSIISLVKHWCRPGLPRFGPLPTYLVSDTHPIWVRVRFAYDTPAGVSEYPDNSDTSRYAPIRPRYAPDTPPIRPQYVHDIFSKYFGGFGQEYALDNRRYAPILLWYVPEWNLYHVLCVAIAFQLFIY
jgi:hypothetical protein